MGKRAITINVEHMSELVRETTRAFLYGGMPSAFLTYLIQGVEEHVKECNVPEDRIFAKTFQESLTRLLEDYRKLELSTYTDTKEG